MNEGTSPCGSTGSSENAPIPAEPFATTRWTVVLAAGRTETPQSRQALEDLCASYWYPLYAYIRHQGHSKEDAEDLVQGFFARFLEKNYLSGLSSAKGKFRAFLLASLKHFLANEWDRKNRQKRGGAATHLSLDWQNADSRYQIEPADLSSPDKIYDRAWAVTLLERVVRRLQEETAAGTKSRLFERLKPFLMPDAGAAPYAQVAAELNMSEGALRVTVHRVRRRYRELLREEIVQTLSEPGEIAEEMRSLQAAFG
jgi:RNA polymerase sigma-70 factor (ECF subfamily)